MSWQGYVDQILVGPGKFDKAAIFDPTGLTAWAATPKIESFPVTPEEMQAIVKGYTDASHLWAGGLKVSGVKFMCIRADDRSIYGRKDNEGICCVKTPTTILVGLHPAETRQQDAAKVMEGFADYLVSVGY